MGHTLDHMGGLVPRSVASLVGNSMPVKVVERVLARVLPSVGSHSIIQMPAAGTLVPRRKIRSRMLGICSRWRLPLGDHSDLVQ